MNKKEWVEGLLFAGFRVLSTTSILAGMVGMAFQLAASWDAFDPSYFGNFLMDTLARPLILVSAGILLHLLAGKLARSMARGFSRS
jgi:hypothetical protein